MVRREGADTGLVIIPDIWGLRTLFDEMVERLSDEWQMSVCAVEPFPGRELPSDDAGPRFAAAAELDDDTVFADLIAAADMLGTERSVLIGFCMGGMYCNKAVHSDRFDRIVSFYGMIRLPEMWQTPGHREPLEVLREGHPDRLLAIVGEVDPYTPPADIAAFEAAGVTTARYPDADHGFVHDPARPAHRPDDAADAWQRAKSWVQRTT